ncbi:MAG TPA: hypothetical protein VIR29_10710 [Anseongella sp.]
MRNLRTKLILALIIVAAAGINGKLLAQETPSRYSRESEAPPKKVFWGANLGVLIGTYTNIGVGPYVGYRLTPTTDIGGGPFFQYAAYRRNGYASYGGRAFARQTVISNFFAQGEYEYLNTEDPEAIAVDPQTDRIDVSSLLLGAGYYGGIGQRTRMHFAILFNVLDNDFKPYQDPVIRIGFSRSF